MVVPAPKNYRLEFGFVFLVEEIMEKLLYLQSLRR